MPELQEGRYAGEFIVSEGNGSISRETITVLSGETLEPGAVLGKVTASGKYKALDPAAADGSEAAVLLNAAKNGSGPSAAGTSSRAEGPNTAEPAATTACLAPEASPEPTDDFAPTASTP